MPRRLRGWVRIDSQSPTGKICSKWRVDAHAPLSRAVIGIAKTLSHSLDPKLPFYLCVLPVFRNFRQAGGIVLDNDCLMIGHEF